MSLTQQTTDAASDSAALIPLKLSEVPKKHPVRIMAAYYNALHDGPLIPDEKRLLEHPLVREMLPYAKIIEPIDLDGVVDFYVLSQGDKLDIRDSNYISQGWMSETIGPEFAEARYHEIIAASIMRTPMFSKGSFPSSNRSYLKLLRGVFPLFCADNSARLRLLIISAEPYVEVLNPLKKEARVENRPVGDDISSQPGA